jgi:hypothetical protein
MSKQIVHLPKVHTSSGGSGGLGGLGSGGGARAGAQESQAGRNVGHQARVLQRSDEVWHQQRQGDGRIKGAVAHADKHAKQVRQ